MTPFKETSPENLLYTTEHEWIQIDGDHAFVGITHHAQKQLGDIVYLELPPVGQSLTAHQAFGVVESVKAVSDLFAPLSGKVTQINDQALKKPEAINQNPYGTWLIQIQIEKADFNTLLKKDAYNDYLKEISK